MAHDVRNIAIERSNISLYLSSGCSTSWDDWSSRLWMKMESLPSTASPSSSASLSIFREFLGLIRERLVSGSEQLGDSTVWQPSKQWKGNFEMEQLLQDRERQNTHRREKK